MDFGTVSWIAAILAGVGFFAVGGVWYGPLFGDRWMAAAGISQDEARQSNLPAIFGGTLVLEVIAAIGLAALIGADATVAAGLGVGLVVGLIIVLPALTVLSLFERKPTTLWLLNAGYNVIGFTVMGAIIGALQ